MNWRIFRLMKWLVATVLVGGLILIFFVIPANITTYQCHVVPQASPSNLHKNEREMYLKFEIFNKFTSILFGLTSESSAGHQVVVESSNEFYVSKWVNPGDDYTFFSLRSLRSAEGNLGRLSHLSNNLTLVIDDIKFSGECQIIEQ